MKTLRILLFLPVLLFAAWAFVFGSPSGPGTRASAASGVSHKAPSSSPTATLTLTAVPTISTTPTVTPTQTPVVRVLPLKPSSITPALIFDYRILPSQIKHVEKVQHIGYIWGADEPEPKGGMAQHYRYVAWAQGFCPGVGIYGPCPRGGPPSLQWLRRYHPTWLEWSTNAKGVPTGPARSKSNPGPILDFTNPAVQQYWLSHYIVKYLKAGFNGVSWDNPTVYDPYSAAGHFDSHHHFIRQYSGAFDDINWARAQAQALGDFLQRVRAIKPTAKFDLAVPVDCQYASMTSFLLPLRYVSMIVDEEGYSNWGSSRMGYIPDTPGPTCSNRWLAKTEFYINMQKAGKGLVLINEEPFFVRPNMTLHKPKARAAMQWALANYLLVKYAHTYFWFGGAQQYGYPLLVQPEESVNVGRPEGDMQTMQGVYARTFTKGLALVNPDPKLSFKVKLPKSTYQDLYRHKVNSIVMTPHSGVVLTLVPKHK